MVESNQSQGSFFETFKDEDILNCFGEKDVIFTYIPEEYEKWKQRGLNIHLTVYPIDPQKFYKSLNRTYKMWDNICVATHGNYHLRSLEIIQELKQHQLILAFPDTPYTKPKMHSIYDREIFPVFIDYCNPISKDERLRQYYNASKYCLSINPGRGFEMGYAEAAMCGCIPIVPNGENWEWLYGSVASLSILTTLKPSCVKF